MARRLVQLAVLFLPEESRDEIGVTGDEGDEERSEEDAEVFQKMIDAVENHDGDISLLYSGAGMYLLGMTFRWTAFRVVHTTKAALNSKQFSALPPTRSHFPMAVTKPRLTSSAVRLLFEKPVRYRAFLPPLVPAQNT